MTDELQPPDDSLNQGLADIGELLVPNDFFNKKRPGFIMRMLSILFVGIGALEAIHGILLSKPFHYYSLFVCFILLSIPLAALGSLIERSRH